MGWGVYLSYWSSKSSIRSLCLSQKSLDGTDRLTMVIGHGTCRKKATKGHTPGGLWSHKSSLVGFLEKEPKPCPKNAGRREELGSEADMKTSHSPLCTSYQG